MPLPTSTGKRADANRQEAGLQSSVYECSHCRYLSGRLLTQCPNCGRVNSFIEAGSATAHQNRSVGTGLVYVCSWPQCNFRTSQPAKECPKCGMGRLLPEAEIRLINIAGGIVAIAGGIVSMLLGIALPISGGFWNPDVPNQPLINLLFFGIGLLLMMGGVSFLKQNNWLFRLFLRLFGR